MDLIEGGLRNPIGHWYYSHKFWFIEKTLKLSSHQNITLIDVGAGSALFSRELLRKNLVTTVVALDTGYEGDYRDSESKIEFRRRSNFEGFSHYLMTDVLEHIENDNNFLSEIVKKAEPGSQFIITVPALMSLWSSHDVFLKHYRRYTKKELKQLIRESGLSIDKCRFTYSTLFPIAFLQRRFFGSKEVQSQLRETGYLINFFLKLALIPDKWFGLSPVGVSLFLLAHKEN